MRDKLAVPTLQFFEDPLSHIEPVKAMNWMHELLGLYKAAIHDEDYKASFDMVCDVVTRFATYLNHHKFVTMKQTEL